MLKTEITGFIKTFEALKERRKAYAHETNNDDVIIGYIKDAIESGKNRVIDIFNHVQQQRPISKAAVKKLLDKYDNEIWAFERGVKTTKHYYLINSDAVLNEHC